MRASCDGRQRRDMNHYYNCPCRKCRARIDMSEAEAERSAQEHVDAHSRDDYAPFDWASAPLGCPGDIDMYTPAGDVHEAFKQRVEDRAQEIWEGHRSDAIAAAR